MAQKGNRENTTPENSFIICKGIVKFALRRSRVAGENGGCLMSYCDWENYSIMNREKLAG